MNPTLEDLFKTAELYGNVRIFSDKKTEPPACYQCTISFNTVKHVELEACSPFRQTLEGALKQAIEKAVLIVESVGDSVPESKVAETKLLIGMD